MRNYPLPVGGPLTTDAPLKVALVTLVERLNARGYQLLDVQIVNDHTRQFGVIDTPAPTTSPTSGRPCEG